MTAIAVPADQGVTPQTALWPLARIEAKRYARHPLFLVGLACATLASIGIPGPTEIDYQVIPSFFIGVIGLVVASRLTRSTTRSAAVLDSAPVSTTTRTAALCLACVVPALAGVFLVLFHRAFMLADPVPEFFYGTYGPAEREVITMVLPVVACAGGPLLGVAVGRWLRLPGAPLLAVVAVVLWSNISGYQATQSMNAQLLLARILHMATPYTAWGTGNGDSDIPLTVLRSYTGSPAWYVVWAICLCCLAVAVALRYDADHRTRRALLRFVGVVAVVAVVSLTMAVAGGNHRLYDSSETGTVPVPASAQHEPW
jgi:hypothetical protein